MTLTREDIAKLKAPFTVAEHEARQGYKNNPPNKSPDKIRWFVYVRREAIINRLDELFPGEWECEMINEQTFQGYATATCRITIRGLKRDGTGNGNGSNDGNNEKGAATDAFKRAASMWGIGLYLQNTPQIWTDYNDQDKYNKAWRQDAENQFNRWLSSLGTTLTAKQGRGAIIVRPNSSPSSDNGNTTQPEQEAGTEPKQVLFKTVSKRRDKNGRDYYGLKAETGEILLSWTREPFATAGYMDRGDWANATYLELNPPIPATIQLNVHGNWELVPNSIPPFDPPWAEFIVDGLPTPENDVAF